MLGCRRGHSSLRTVTPSTWRRAPVVRIKEGTEVGGVPKLLDNITIPQRLLAAKAWHDKTHQFDNVYYFICRQDWIEEALNQVLDNKGSITAGIDSQTIANLSKPEDKSQLIQTIHSELKGKTYLPMPVRRAYIPKNHGKRRPLGIPTIKDRVVECLLKMLLEPIYESDFATCSSGFRPMRRTMDCVAQVLQEHQRPEELLLAH